MNPFHLICKSCAARLKVTRMSAVGQQLACPKCGSMVQVQPPEDWEPGDDELVNQAEVPETETLTDFGDVESVLSGGATAQRPVPRPRPARPAGAVPPRTHRPVGQPGQGKQNVRAKKPATEQPMLPDHQWTSAEAKKRKRLVTLLAVSIGSVVIIGALIAALLVSWSGDPEPDQLAQQKSPETQPDGVADQDSDVGDGGEETADQPIGADEGSSELLDQNPLVTGPIEQSGVIDPGDSKAPEIAMDDDRPGFVAPTSDPDSASKGTEPNAADPGLAVVPPSAEDSFSDGEGLLPEASDPVDPDSVKTLQDDLGDLASLLENSETSIRDLQDQAAQFDATLHRASKYYVDRPKPLSVDLQRQLGLPLSGLIYEQPTSLTQMLRTMSRISSIPITIDVRQLDLMQVPVNPRGTLKLTDTTIGEAIENVAGQFELDVVQRDGSLIVTRQAQPGFVDAEIELPQVPGLDESTSQRFIAGIKTLVAPELWVLENDPATLQLLDGKLTVSAPEGVVEIIRTFVRKLEVAAQLAQAPDDQELKRKLASRWSRSAEMRAVEAGLAPTIRQPILKFLQRLERETETTVVVDWFNAIPQGWNLTAEVPGDLTESTVEAVINELAAAMELVPLAVDEQTILLTTTAAAMQYIDLEVYPVVGQVAQQAQPGTLERAVFETLGGQVQTQLVKVVYEPKCQCMIVVAPQSIQRQVEGLLATLNQQAGRE